MSITRLKIENLSKQYRLGQVGTGTLSHDLNRFWYKVRGKEDPYTLIGSENDRSKAAESNYAWALQDINLEVKEGEVLGIIGKNGAGKSTLLKILSQVTGPTTGEIKINGRIGSLLEVGTGMHPELTGRENIYLNGAILGMSKAEIRKNFDAIVAFAGIAAYVDTPFKRYSSGMRVRLGFAVAAFLEPEILIVDEVLAVGDAEFQRKAIGKMKEISGGHGRTVLFVSHNMEAVKNLCTRAIFLENGKIKAEGTPLAMVEQYLTGGGETNSSLTWEYEQAPGNEWVKAKHISIEPQDQKEYITVKTPIKINFEFWLEQEDVDTNLSLHLYAATGECIFNVITQLPVPTLKRGLHTSECIIPGDLLNSGNFFISLMVVRDTSVPLYNFENIIEFTVEEEREKTNFHGRFPGVVRPKLDFNIKT